MLTRLLVQSEASAVIAAKLWCVEWRTRPLGKHTSGSRLRDPPSRHSIRTILSMRRRVARFRRYTAERARNFIYTPWAIESASSRRLQRRVEKATFVTLDVFDTALFRCVPEPEDENTDTGPCSARRRMFCHVRSGAPLRGGYGRMLATKSVFMKTSRQ